MSFKMQNLLTLPVTTVLDRAVSTAVVIILAMEDITGPSWHVNATIRPSVLKSIADYLNQENNQDNKRVLLQCFGVSCSCFVLAQIKKLKKKKAQVKGFSTVV